jgi:general secretion pathway protein J
MGRPARHPRRRHDQGFTLIELLVAVSIMALMTVMGWRALDGMVLATGQTRAHTDAVLTLEAGLAQWITDLDALIELPHTSAIDWDGRALRVTRRHSADPREGVLVIAWSRAARGGVAQWLRWQSAPVRSRADWQSAWDSAAQWAQSPGEQAKQQEVAIAPMEQWQVLFFRGGTWSNALSSAGAVAPEANLSVVPDGVRLIMVTPAPHPLAGRITRDWVRPTLTGSTP